MQSIYLFLIILISPALIAQNDMDKPELDELKKEINHFKNNLEAFRQFKQQPAKLKQEIEAKTLYLNQLKELFDNIADKNDQQAMQIDSLKLWHKFYRKALEKPLNYKIQIGIFNTHPILRFAGLHSNFTYTKTKSGLYKLFVGHFNHYNEAYRFNQLLKRNGLQSFVVQIEALPKN